eukprot:10873-Heterococcus_DN1.PRE.1
MGRGTERGNEGEGVALYSVCCTLRSAAAIYIKHCDRQTHCCSVLAVAAPLTLTPAAATVRSITFTLVLKKTVPISCTAQHCTDLRAVCHFVSHCCAVRLNCYYACCQLWLDKQHQSTCSGNQSQQQKQ